MPEKPTVRTESITWHPRKHGVRLTGLVFAVRTEVHQPGSMRSVPRPARADEQRQSAPAGEPAQGLAPRPHG
jgi:hypothetical protein